MVNEDRSLPLHTVYDPDGRPYISIIEEEETIRMQLHAYDEDFPRGIFMVIDKRAVHHLINALGKVSIKGIKL